MTVSHTPKPIIMTTLKLTDRSRSGLGVGVPHLRVHLPSPRQTVGCVQVVCPDRHPCGNARPRQVAVDLRERNGQDAMANRCRGDQDAVANRCLGDEEEAR